MSSPAPAPTAARSAWPSAVLAAGVVGTACAMSNLTNFFEERRVYFAVWGAAHVLAFLAGLALGLTRRAGLRPSTYVMLGLFAAGVEAGLVFGVLDGLTLVNSRYPYGGTLIAGTEDWVAAAATAVLFTAGAMNGLRRGRLTPAGRTATAPVAGVPAAPGVGVTQFLTAAGPLFGLLAAGLKFGVAVMGVLVLHL